jgi:hypothetical protein
MNSKTCNICQTAKELNQYKSDKKKDKIYYRNICLECYREKLRSYYYKNKQKYIDTAAINNKKYRAMKKTLKKV